VDESSKDVTASDVVRGERWDIGVVGGCSEFEGPVRSFGVVVSRVLGEDAPGVLLVVERRPVGALVWDPGG
jgi:hypothetical protein